MPTLLSGFGALAVDDRGRRARLAPFLLACRDVERVMEALQRAILVPQGNALCSWAAGLLAAPATGNRSKARREDGV